MKTVKFSFLFYVFFFVISSFSSTATFASSYSLTEDSQFWKKPHTLKCVSSFESKKLVLNIDLFFIKDIGGSPSTYFHSRWRNKEVSNEVLANMGDRHFNFHPEKAQFYGSKNMSPEKTVDFQIGKKGQMLKIPANDSVLVRYSNRLMAYANRQYYPEVPVKSIRKNLTLRMRYFEDPKQTDLNQGKKIIFNCRQTTATPRAVFHFCKERVSTGMHTIADTVTLPVRLTIAAASVACVETVNFVSQIIVK